MIWRALTCPGAARAHEDLDAFASAVTALDTGPADGDLMARTVAALGLLEIQLVEFEVEARRASRETATLYEHIVDLREAEKLLTVGLTHRTDAPRRAVLAASAARIRLKRDAIEPLLVTERREEQLAASWCAALHGIIGLLRNKLADAGADGESRPAAVDAARLPAVIDDLAATLDAVNRESAQARADGQAYHFHAVMTDLARLSLDPNIAAALAILRAAPTEPDRPDNPRTNALTVNDNANDNNAIKRSDRQLPDLPAA